MAVLEVEPWRPKLATWRRMVELGLFEEFDERVELLDGVITPMSPPSPEHERAIEFLMRTAFETLGRAYRVRVAAPLSLDDRWEPQPDLALVPWDAPEPYHPRAAALGCEVAVSSLQKDREVKRLAYARFGIPEYWIVIPDRHRLEVFHAPADGDYRERREVAGGVFDSVTVPGLRLDLDALWDWVDQR